MGHWFLFHVNSSEIITETVRHAASHTGVNTRTGLLRLLVHFGQTGNVLAGDKTTEADIAAQRWLPTKKLSACSDF